MIHIPLYVRQIIFISVPFLAGIACIWISYRNPGGKMRSLWLPGIILLLIGLYSLVSVLGLIGGPVTTPAG